MTRIFVVSALPAVRAGLRALLSLDGGLEVVGEAARLGDGEAELVEIGAEVIVVDGAPGFELDELVPGARGLDRGGLVILGPIAGDQRLPDELAGRSWAYLPRETSGERLIAAIRAVANGLVVVDGPMGGHLFARGARAVAAANEEIGEELTAREREVLQLVALGLPNKTIAARLGVSEHTVKFHVASILAKLGAGSRTEAVHVGARRGLVVL